MPKADPARRRQIIDAAIGVFLRYGHARTTMADVAQAVGISRAALYLSFADKDAIFSAVVTTMVADKLAAIRAGLVSRATLADQLRFACDAWGAEGFELVRAHPDAKDMFDLGFASVCSSYDAFESLLADVIRGPLAGAPLDVAPAELARMMVYSIKGFKDVARSGADVRRMIGSLVTVVVAAVESPSTKTKEKSSHGQSRRAVPRRRR